MTSNKITVLTASYNRANTLNRLYQSLCEQSCLDFEWLLVDDGSEDGTSELVKSWINLAPFVIRYSYQQNAGKHVALNTGFEIATGDWVFIVDSDDLVTGNAVEAISAAITSGQGAGYSGYCFRKATLSGELIGRTVVQDDEIWRAMHPTQAGKFYCGDLAYVLSRDAFQRNPFPVISGEKFLPELYVWNQIGDQAPILYNHSQIIYLAEYLLDGYSVNFKRNLKRNPRGFGLFYRNQFLRERHFLPKLKCAIRATQCFFYSCVKGR